MAVAEAEAVAVAVAVAVAAEVRHHREEAQAVVASLVVASLVVASLVVASLVVGLAAAALPAADQQPRTLPEPASLGALRGSPSQGSPSSVASVASVAGQAGTCHKPEPQGTQAAVDRSLAAVGRSGSTPPTTGPSEPLACVDE